MDWTDSSGPAPKRSLHQTSQTYIQRWGEWWQQCCHSLDWREYQRRPLSLGKLSITKSAKEMARYGRNNDGCYGARLWGWEMTETGSGACLLGWQPSRSATVAVLQYLYYSYVKVPYPWTDNWRINCMSVSMFETQCQITLTVSKFIMII
jgi:hypothetical protein